MRTLGINFTQKNPTPKAPLITALLNLKLRSPTRSTSELTITLLETWPRSTSRALSLKSHK